MCACMLSCFSRVRLCAALRTAAHQALLSMGFSRQGYWSGLPFRPPEDLPKSGIKLASLTSPVLVGRSFTTSATWQSAGRLVQTHTAGPPFSESEVLGWSPWVYVCNKFSGDAPASGPGATLENHGTSGMY